MTNVTFQDGSALELSEVLDSLELTLRMARINRHPAINRLIRSRCDDLMKTVQLRTTREILYGIRSKQLCVVELEKALTTWKALQAGELEVIVTPTTN